MNTATLPQCPKAEGTSLDPQTTDNRETYEQRLYQYTIESGKHEPRFLIFRGLQALNIIRLQNDLARYKNKIWGNEAAEETEKLTKLIHDYANAIRNYEYLSKLVPITGSQASRGRLDLELYFGEDVGNFAEAATSYRRFQDPAMLSSDGLRDILKRILPRSVTWIKSEIRRRDVEYLAHETPQEVSPFVDILARFLVAFLGGSLLVAPMLIMRLPEVNLTKSLCTVSASVLLFAAFLSMFFKASNTDTMIATATYAAVLVVFVGTST